MTALAPENRRRVGRLVALLIAAIGFAMVAGALYMAAKATLGQALLERAWLAAESRGAKGVEAVKPWLWADIHPVAKLEFPSLGETRLVLNEASGEAMAWGPGHVSGTQPLGAPGVSAAAAHRDTHFALLGQIGPGDPIELETLEGQRATYNVVSAHVVNADHWRFPLVDQGPDVLVLSTCWPLDALEQGPERLVVFAMREPRMAAQLAE